MPILQTKGSAGLGAFLKGGALPSAITGGVLSEDSTYYYRTFFGSGTLTVTGAPLTADVLIIAGGGAGTSNVNPGGGAGGLLGLSSQSFSPTSFTVTVGAGASGGTGGNGSNSSITGLTAAVGGGAPGTWQTPAAINGSSGGSGGGGGGSGNGTPGTGGSGTSGQGYAGGNGSNAGSGYGGGGGGGGAGGVGANASGAAGGAGGVGSSAYSSWGLATGTGQNVSGTVYYAGGGGGGAYNGNAGGTYSGGNGGGGAGSGANNGVGGNGLVNTGGGAGGGGSNGGQAGNGGSGLVIIRYLKTAVQPSTDSFELIGTISLTASQASITFAGIPSSQYKHLQLRCVTRSDLGGTVQDVYMRLNGDATAGNYYYHSVYGTGASSGSESSQSPTGARFMQAPGTSAASNLFYSAVTDILNPFSTSNNKTVRTISGSVDANNNRIWVASNAWFSTSAVTSITIITSGGNNFVSGSRFSLYGVRG